MKKILALILAALVGVVWNAVAQEPDEFDILIGTSDEVFSYTAPLAGQVTFRSPLRNADGTDMFAPVNSKYAQPRTVGTNPHIGVDLSATEGTPVYPVKSGRVYIADLRPGRPTGRGIGRVTIQFDLNGDGQYDLTKDNLFVTYLHMKNIPGKFGPCNPISECDVTTDTIVGEVSNVSPGTIPVHLHFEINTITGISNCKGNFRDPGCTAVRPGRYYEGLTGTQWNSGRDLDFITDILWRDSRIAEGHVYAMNNEVPEAVLEKDVVLFHRVRGTSTWSWAFMEKDPVGHRFWLNLSQLYLSGTELELYGRATRSGIPKPPRTDTDICQTTPYNFSFMKPRRHRPLPCNDIDADDVFEVTLRY